MPYCRTLYESKGLEFNDVGLAKQGMSHSSNPMQVLLYNFFKDSTANANQWRLVMRDCSDGTHVPDFDETKHAGMCTEVLFLIHSPRSG